MQQSLSQSVLTEQLKLLYAALPASIIATIINALVLVYVLSGHVSAMALSGWLTVVGLVGLGRFLSYHYFQSSLAPQKFLLLFNVGAFSSGISWGLAAIFLFVPDELGYQVFLAFVIAGMCAGAVSSLSMLKFPVYSYLALSLIPLAIRMLVEGAEINIAMGVMTLLFMIMLFITASRIFRTVYENILLRLESDKNEKTLRESEDKYRSIFEAAPVGIIQYNAHGMIMGSNAAASRILGLPAEKLRQCNLVAMKDNPQFEQAVRLSLSGEFAQFIGDTKVFNPKLDLPIKMYFKSLSGLDTEIIGGVAIVEDISEQKRMEKLKTEFVSTVSHELRTPLTAIKGSIDLLQLVPAETRQELIAILKRNTDRLVYLINDLLDIDKIVSGNLTFDFQSYDVMVLVKAAIADNQGYAREHKTEIKLEAHVDNVKIHVDKNRFNQILANLLSNAAKFTRPGTVVTIGVYPNGKNILIKVRDQGEGIPESFQGKLFERFTQADSSTTRKKGGTGLGLYITKQLVEAMHGKISYQTWQGKGTEFNVEFAAHV